MGTVRTKFKVNSKTELAWGFAIDLSAVHGGSPENDSFFKFTPSASMTLQTINADAAASFIVGAEYYIDITPANNPEVSTT
jgi:hypothetical protein